MIRSVKVVLLALGLGLARRLILLTARPLNPAPGGVTLVLAPHPDDETLGCGALIARLVSLGTRVVIVCAADGAGSTPSAVLTGAELAAIRDREFVAACRALGVREPDVIRLGLPDGAVADHEAELTRQLTELVASNGVTRICATSPGDPHPDHAAVGRAALRAAGPAGAEVLLYPIWQWDDRRSLDAPTTVELTDGRAIVVAAPIRQRAVRIAVGPHHVRKGMALDAHKSQVENLTGEADWTVLERRFLRRFSGRWELFWPVPVPPAHR